MTAVVLRLVGVNESTYYARKKQHSKQPGFRKKPVPAGRPIPQYSLTIDGQKISDAQIEEWLMELAEGEEQGYGYRNLAHALYIQRGLLVNHKKAYRLCKKLGILQKQRRKKCKYPRRLPQNRLVTGPNQLWQMDIKYGYVAGYDRFFFLFDIIDVFDRVLVGYHVGSSCEAKDVCTTVKQALQGRLQPDEKKPVLRSDNGPQFVSNLFGDMCLEDENDPLIHERIPPKTPNLNAYIESFHSIIERDLLSKEDYSTFEEAYESVHRYIAFYNQRRFHGSLKRMSPLQYYEAWKANELPDIKIAL
ncbi:IS3 family transposase [Paenibacillus mesophilus]|uniref:IS3 family transposase n=1 Tax=Paenibacillus mesophilus TaxID=2582849 RepID=UPI0013053ED6|nr:IS3 family transposase [Paenibacillus mesophilus]